jgi:hypothetical protein
MVRLRKTRAGQSVYGKYQVPNAETEKRIGSFLDLYTLRINGICCRSLEPYLQMSSF